MTFQRFADSLGEEDILHRDVGNYLEWQTGFKIHHSPNEGKRGAFARYLLVLFKVKSGFPDLIIFYKGYHMAIELKAKGNEPTDNQWNWLIDLKENGWYAIWSDNYNEVILHVDLFRKLVDGKISEAAETGMEKEGGIKTPELRKRKEKGGGQRRRSGKIIRSGRAW